MANLEAMLEQRGIATPREMSEAVARCQLHGGDLTTSLLQFVNADEAQLSAALSECYELPAAAVGSLPAPDDAALRSLPRDIAERCCCFPLEATPGRLVLAVAHPLEPSLRDELGFTLGVSIEQRIALEVRIRQALSRFYGLPLSARNQRGIARLEGDVDGAGHETPLGMWSDAQLSALPRPPSDLAARDPQRPPSARPRARSETPRQGTSAFAAGAPPSSGTRASRRRGPLTLAQARDELTRAGTRNEVLDIFFGFASQFFEYSASFAVHNSLAEGLDAWGKGADRDTVLGIGVPLDLPSSLSEVAESCKVRLTRLGKEGIDRTLAADLQRQFNAKALVLPVSLRGRCAVLLYADNGEADVVEREVADVIAIAPDVASALGRIILQRKKEAARQKAPDNADLSAIGRRSLPPHSDEPGRVPGLLDGLEPIPNENRERSRNNARRSSRPDASAGAPQPERDAPSVPAQPVVAIGPNGNGASPSPPAAEVGSRSDASFGDDPVFLLARPQDKGRISVLPPEPRPLPSVARPPVSITHPAPIIGSRPRLPSVIVDPDSADPEASDRLTRAAAITRAPTQARNGPARRPQVPLLADAPRTLSPPVYERRGARSSRGGERTPLQASESRNREAGPRAGQERETHEGAARPWESEPSEASGLESVQVSSRPALHPTSVDLSEPPPADALGAESSSAGSVDAGSVGATPLGAASSETPSHAEPPAESGIEPAFAEAEPEDEEALGASASSAWPPPIMDHSPPPRQPPLTALVPIIIADSPKSRRGYTSRTATTARPGARQGLAKSPLPRSAPSSNPPAHAGPASPTVPSPARARKLDPASGPIASAVPVGVAAPTPVALAAAAPAAVDVEDASAPGDAAQPEPAVSTPSAGNGGSRLTNALARAAARAASTASPRGSDPPAHPSGDDGRSAAVTAAPPGARAAQPPAPPSSRSASTPPPLQTRANAGPNTPRLVLPSRAGERTSRPPPPPMRVLAPGASADARGGAEAAATNTAPTAVDRRATPTILGLGAAAASPGSTATEPEAPPPSAPAANAPAATGEPSPHAASSGAAFTSREDAEVARRAGAGSTLIGVAAVGTASDPSAGAALVPETPAASSRAAAIAPELPASRETPAASPARESGSPARDEPAATTDSPTPRVLPAFLSSAPPQSMLGADDAPPDSVELAWDALISEPPPAGAILSSLPPVAAPRGPALGAASASNAMGAPAASAPPAAGSGSVPDVSRPSQPPPSPASVPFAPAVSEPSAASAAPSSPIHPAPSRSDAVPSSPIHPVPSRPMSASSSNSSAAPSSPTHPAPSSSSPAPSSPISPLPSRAIDAVPNSSERVPSSTERMPSSAAHAPPSRPGAAAAPSSVQTLTPPSGPELARGAIFPPPPSVDPEIEELVDQVCQGNLRAVQDLARIGAASVPQVMARFPGPVISERAGPSSRASECGPLLQALAAIGNPATPSISLSSEHSDARVRRWATLLLGEMPGPEACRAVVQRLADDVPRVHQAALDAARLLLASSAADLFRKTLFEVAEAEDAPLTLRLRTLEHVAKLKDSASVPRLISFLAADMEPIVHKALWALTVVTRHDFGRDAGAWTEFWETQKARHRLEWLIDALDGRDPRLRKAAADELREEAGELFGFAEDQPRPERLEAQQAFRRWWETRGAARYGRA